MVQPNLDYLYLNYPDFSITVFPRISALGAYFFFGGQVGRLIEGGGAVAYSRVGA